MTLPREFSNHHTVWVGCDTCSSRATRYAVDGDGLVVFGDDLPGLADGTRVTLRVHEIAGGPLLAELPATVHEVRGEDVGEAAMYELLDHVPLGRTSDEVRRGMEHHRATRRVLALVP